VKNAPRTIRQFFDEWLTAIRVSVKPTTLANYRNYASYYVVPIIGARKLQEIIPETITRLYAHLLEKGRRRGDSNQLMYAHWKKTTDAGRKATAAEIAAVGGVSVAGGKRAAQRYRAGRIPAPHTTGLDARTVHSVHTMLNRAFADAVSWRYIAENPVTTATRVRQMRKGHDVWTPDQLRRFLAEARAERLYAMWLMFATTGVRRSEAAGAKRAMLDLDPTDDHGVGHPGLRGVTGRRVDGKRRVPVGGSRSTGARRPRWPITWRCSTRNVGSGVATMRITPGW
jgi:integrase